MTAHSVNLIGFDDDDALDAILSRFRLLADYKSVLPEYLTDILRQQYPHVDLHSLELLGTQECDLDGIPSPKNKDHLVIESMRVPVELRIYLSTNGHDLHELDVTLVIYAKNVHTTPQITCDMLIRNHREIS